jgi:hypothetical protein
MYIGERYGCEAGCEIGLRFLFTMGMGNEVRYLRRWVPVYFEVVVVTKKVL